MQLRDYQIQISNQATDLLRAYNIAYLALSVRVGKTLTALQAVSNYGANSVLFLTKKKAISSIEKDYKLLNPGYKFHCTNYEQAANIDVAWYDLIICDESHSLSQYPKMAVRTALLKEKCEGKPIIYLSGSPTPESWSQIFHQLHISSFSPFAEYSNFYKWANDGYVNKKVKYVFNRQLNDWSDANQNKIWEKIKHLFISFSQEDAGFKEDVQEEILTVKMKPGTYYLADRIRIDRVFYGRNGDEILADTNVKLQQKMHQIFSGTVKDEAGNGIIFDQSKAEFIRDHFKGQKIAVYYKFIAEATMLISVFGSKLTTSPEEFNQSDDKVFFSQIQSGREGVNLSTADAIVMMNIDFSHVSYIQVRGRMQTKDRTKAAMLYWIFSEGGIEEKIYERVKNKQDYNNYYFKKDYGIESKAIKNIAALPAGAGAGAGAAARA
jgi:hypothetical protein